MRHEALTGDAVFDPDVTIDTAEPESLGAEGQQKARREALFVCGRLLLAGVFLASAVLKALSFDPAHAGALGGLFWASVVLELVCGSLLTVGLYARGAALVLLMWIGVGLVFFHGDLTLDVNRIFGLANLGIAGGLFVFVAEGGGLLSLDRWLSTRAQKSA